MIAFLYYFSALGAILAGSLIFPALVAFGYQETETAYKLLMYGLFGGFLCVGTLLAIMGRMGGLERNSAILLAVISWFAFPVISAIPVADISNISFADAVFQTTSSLTTTGAIIFDNPDSVPKSVLFLLAQMQWLGGLATLITLTLVLAPWEIGGLPPVSSVSVAASIVASHSRLIKFCGRIIRTFLSATLACFVLLLLCQVKPYDAAILSFTAVSTGGILPPGESLDLMLGTWGMIVLATFFIIGATSIFWHRDVIRLRLTELKKHRESYFVIAVWVVLAMYITYKITAASGTVGEIPTASYFGEGVLNAASIVSTAGIQSRPGVFSLLSPLLVLVIAFIGAGCYSTAGGIKFYRIGGMYSLAQFELNQLIYPHSVRPSHFGNTEFNQDFMKAIWSLFAILIVTVAVTSCALSFSGLTFQVSFTAAIAAIANAGPLYGAYWDVSGSGLWPTYAEMLWSQKLLLATVMLAGRLEVIAVVATVTLLARRIN